MKVTRRFLRKCNIRFHKIASTHADVLKAFPPSEIAENFDYIDINKSSTQVHSVSAGRSIKMNSILSAMLSGWISQNSLYSMPLTNGILYTAFGNFFSSYDPLGITAPIGLAGSLLQRSFSKATVDEGFDWDTKLPNEFEEDWESSSWVSQLHEVSPIKLRRSYRPAGFGPVTTS